MESGYLSMCIKLTRTPLANGLHSAALQKSRKVVRRTRGSRRSIVGFDLDHANLVHDFAPLVLARYGLVGTTVTGATAIGAAVGWATALRPKSSRRLNLSLI